LQNVIHVPQAVLAQLAVDLTERSVATTLRALRNAAHICSAEAAAAVDEATPQQQQQQQQLQDAALQAAEDAMKYALRRLAVAQALAAAALGLEATGKASASSCYVAS
jgi:hypothetical protein